ncbi:MAG: LAGLIDADG family homing endonuclease [Halanaerobiales bacterium]
MSTRRSFTIDEINFIKKNYKKLGRETVAEKLNRSIHSVGSKAKQLGLTRKKNPGWKKEDEIFLENNYNKMPNDELAKILGRSKIAIQKKAYKLGLRKEDGTWSESEENYLKNNYGLLSYSEIAEKLGRSYDAVKTKARIIDIVENNQYTEEEDKIIMDEYSHNPQIADLLPNRDYESIKTRAQKLGVRMSRGYNNINSRFFEKWSPEMAYVTGFIAADGYVNEDEHKLDIGLKKSDKKLLEDINKVMECDKTLYTDAIKVRLSIVNHKIVDDLVNMGIVQAKSLTLRFPKVPGKYLSHFVRGYFDGDGTIGQSHNKPRLRILGTHEFLINMRNQISKTIGVNPNKPHVKENIYTLSYSGSTAMKVLNWIYKDATIYLERKYEKYMSFKENV